MNQKKVNLLLVDSLISNDYTLCLALALVNEGISIKFVVPENRAFNENVPFEVKRWSPAKNDSYGKTVKAYKYFLYLTKVLLYSVYHRDIIIHFQFFRRRSDGILFYLMSLLGSHMVYTAHNVFPHERGAFDVYLQKLVYKGASRIIVHSDYIKRKILNNFNIDEKKINIIPHGNFDIYLPQQRLTKDQAREKLGLSPDDKVLLFFGLIRAYKGLDILLDAFNIAKECDPKLKILVVGRPMNDEVGETFTNKIESFAAGNRIIKRLEHIPSDDIQFYFEACDIVVLPYKNIDHSGIVHLAFSFAKPLIVSPVGDFPETIEEGKTGFVLTENTPEVLSKVILSAFSQNGRLAEMGNYAKYLNDTKYSWGEIGKCTAALYRDVLC